MILNRTVLEKIRRIIEKNYRSLLVNLAGKKALTDDELKALKDAGIETFNNTSLLSLIYYNNVLNDPGSSQAPISVAEMQAQQAKKPEGVIHRAAEEHINQNFAQSVEKIKTATQTAIEGLIREYNLVSRNSALQILERPEEVSRLVRESSRGGLKQKLRDLTHDGTRDWERVAVTETSNALGLGAIDRIVKMNEGKDLEKVYVYRIPVNDAALCKYCRRFYLDDDEAPAIYRLAAILANGSNFGKKQADWRPVAGATHPNERCSGLLELKHGWKVLAGGRLEFVGKDNWQAYIDSKLRS